MISRSSMPLLGMLLTWSVLTWNLWSQITVYPTIFEMSTHDNERHLASTHQHPFSCHCLLVDASKSITRKTEHFDKFFVLKNMWLGITNDEFWCDFYALANYYLHTYIHLIYTAYYRLYDCVRYEVVSFLRKFPSRCSPLLGYFRIDGILTEITELIPICTESRVV